MKYQILEVRKKLNHANSKARDDVALFAEQHGYRKLNIKCYDNKSLSVTERLRKYLASFPSWISVLFTVKKNSVVLIQNPYYHRHFGREFVLNFLKKHKNCSFISVIHDVEKLRGSGWSGKNTAEEFEFMKQLSDCFIVHNKKMVDKFLDMGFKSDSLVSLDIFDYYTECEVNQRPIDELDSDIVIAGNLNPKKSAYVYEIPSLKNPVKVNLYGPNFAGETTDSFRYIGSFPSDEVPNVLCGKFGLIWDGKSVNTCSDETGKYLKVNNPHKTSLYIVAGMPIAIWEEAAMADFVTENQIGITVSSLEELNEKIRSVSDDEYEQMRRNTLELRDKLINGKHLKYALDRCEERLEKKYGPKKNS